MTLSEALYSEPPSSSGPNDTALQGVEIRKRGGVCENAPWTPKGPHVKRLPARPAAGVCDRQEPPRGGAPRSRCTGGERGTAAVPGTQPPGGLERGRGPGAGRAGLAGGVADPRRWPSSPSAHGPLLPDQSHRRPADPHGQRDASPRWVSWGPAHSGSVRPAAGPRGCMGPAVSSRGPPSSPGTARQGLGRSPLSRFRAPARCPRRTRGADPAAQGLAGARPARGGRFVLHVGAEPCQGPP